MATRTSLNTFRAFQIWIPLLATLVIAQTVILVKVGDDGQFYTPNTIQASTGTIINFQFVGTAHSVVQGNFSSPCQPLQGGFDSGVTGLEVMASSLDNPVQWNLTITNDNAPIWFYCKVQQPKPHCQNGMVGVINPPADGSQTLDAYHNASMDASPPTFHSNGSSLQGVDASASATPALPVIPMKPNIGAIVGGLFGGLAGMILLIGLVYLLLHSRKKARKLEEERLATDGSSWLSVRNVPTPSVQISLPEKSTQRHSRIYAVNPSY